MAKIVCSDSRHEARKNLPGWVAELGETSQGSMPSGYICPACARMRPFDATAQVGHGASHVIITGDGGFAVEVPLVYDDGAVVGWQPLRMGRLINKLTPAERTQLGALLAKLRA